jgi:hypothetical protein
MKPTKQTISDDAVEREANEETDVSLIGRRKIIKGLSGVPFLLTFSHNSKAEPQASFARCAQGAIDRYNSQNPDNQKSLNAFNKVFSDGTGYWWSNREKVFYTDSNGNEEFYWQCKDAEISDACLTSFALGSLPDREIKKKGTLDNPKCQR